MPSQANVPPPSPRRALLARAAVGLVLTMTIALGSAFLLHASIDPVEEAAVEAAAPARGAALATVASWSYQLQGLDVAAAARSPYDLLVVDEALGSQMRPEERQQAVKLLKTKPDGSRRLVLAYVSIGEAEEYRPYWNKAWVAPGLTTGTVGGMDVLGTTQAFAAGDPGRAPLKLPLHQPTSLAPAWLGDENPDWRGNYRVRFWDRSWQALLIGGPEAAVDRIIAAGFDGVYLDRADVYAGWLKERRQSRTEMIALIDRIGRYGREAAPGFIVTLQNAEELLESSRVRGAIDAVAKEDLLFGIDGAGEPNAARDIEASLGYLKRAKADELPVMVVEYVSDPALIEAARQKLGEHGFVPYFAPHDLNRLARP